MNLDVLLVLFAVISSYLFWQFSAPLIRYGYAYVLLVTFICGFFMSGIVAIILQTIGVGAFCAIILILFVLPSYLVLLDKFFIKESDNNELIA